MPEPASPGLAAPESASDLPPDLAALLAGLARASDMGADDILSSVTTLMRRYRAQRALGTHFGVAADPSRLDTELVQTGSLVTDLVRRLKPDEHDEERGARLRAEQRTALLADVKGVVLFVALLVGVITVTGICGWLALFSPDSPLETQHWAQTMLAAVVSGAVSFLVGRKVAGK